MTDEAVTEEQPVEEDAAAVGPEEPQEPKEPRYMTPEEVAEAVSRGTNDIKTWLGRRDKDLFNQIGTIIEQRMAKKVETPEELSSKLLEDPVTTIKKIMSETQFEDQTKAQRHNSETFTYLGNMMDSDPLYQDKDLGNDLVEEVKKMYQQGKIDTSLSPAAAAKVLHADALANVMRNRKKSNPLSKNAPGSSIGTLSPGVPSSKPKQKVPQLSEETIKFAQKWGYKDEDLIRIYGSKS